MLLRLAVDSWDPASGSQAAMSIGMCAILLSSFTCLSETESLCVALAVLQLNIQIRLALNLIEISPLGLNAVLPF